MYKIMLLGEPATGKSSFRIYLCSQNQQKPVSIPLEHYPSVGIQVGVKTLEFNENEFVNLQIWDTTGNHPYHKICQKYYNQMHGFIIFTDITNADSFQQIQFWIKKIQENRFRKDYFVGVLANKADLNRKYSQDDVRKQFGKQIDFCRQISLKTGLNLQQGLRQLGMKACKGQPNHIVSDVQMNQKQKMASENGYCNCQIM